MACSDWRVIFMWRDININFGLVLCVLKSLIRWRMGRMGCAIFFWLDLPGGWIFLPQKCAAWRAGARVRAEGNTPAVVSSSYAGKGRCVVGGAWRQAAATANVAKYLMRSPCSRVISLAWIIPAEKIVSIIAKCMYRMVEKEVSLWNRMYM